MALDSLQIGEQMEPARPTASEKARQLAEQIEKELVYTMYAEEKPHIIALIEAALNEHAAGERALREVFEQDKYLAALYMILDERLRRDRRAAGSRENRMDGVPAWRLVLDHGFYRSDKIQSPSRCRWGGCNI